MLTDKRIRELWENYSPTQGIESFARSIEAEVSAQYTALIQQLVEALYHLHQDESRYGEPEAAIAAARACLNQGAPQNGD